MFDAGMSNLHTIPFLWMHGEDEATLRHMVDVINESGNGALCIESRPHPDFLGPKWWQDVDVVLDECKKLGMQVWILDDERFPTGYAAGRAAGSEHRIRYLNERHIDIAGPVSGSSILLTLPIRNADVPKSGGFVSVVAAKRIPGRHVDHSTYINMEPDPVEDLIDLTPFIDGDVVYWDVPEGVWRVFIITTQYGTGRDPRRDIYINSLTEQGTRILLDSVYEEHYQHYASEFGKTIQGFFSDEPQFGGGHGYHCIIGRAPNLMLPWSDEVIPEMSRTLGEDATGLLPGLWTDIGENTARVRYAYMDAVTRLYGRNFCGQIGEWCRSHGVGYMGHVIEENNAHARLGAGTGHYFRALWGQDYSGIDIVLNGLIPGLKGESHSQQAHEFEADDDSYFYNLAQMAVSLSHIDPKKKGRSMCEIFGAYGWQEGGREMKWLADFMLSRGINHFVPHAYSPKPFPDPDCPPHFYARGENPQFRYFDRLINHMNRVSSLISGGRAITKVGALYHAEAEWVTKDMMKTQEIIKRMAQKQIEADIIPADALIGAEIKDGALILSDYAYEAFVVPYTRLMPAETAGNLARLAENGVRVIFAEELPEASCTQPCDMQKVLAGCRVLPVDEIAAELADLGYAACSGFEPDLKLYPYVKDGKTYITAFNENIHTPTDTVITVNENKPVYRYDPFNDKMYETDYRTEGGKTVFSAHLDTYELCVFIVTDEKTETVSACEKGTEETATEGWRVSMADAKQYPAFTPVPEITEPVNLNRKDMYPRFSGTVRYETEFVSGGEKAWTLDLGTVGETAEVFINGVSAGVKLTPPYVFDVGELVKAGRNELAVEVTNTLVYRMHDGFSFWHPIGPSGLVGPVRLMKGQK